MAAATRPLSAVMDAGFRRFLASAPPPRIILGSSSSSRRAIMDGLASAFGFAYEVRTADIDEKAIRHAAPEELVLALGGAKADAILAKLAAEAPPAPGGGGGGDGYLLTCDQVVVHEGRILEKPEGEEEARRFITGYARAPAATVGSVVVTRLATGARRAALDLATIHMAPLPAADIDALIAEGEVLWCAGGLMVEHPLVAPRVTRIEGAQDSVMGLSAYLVVRLLLQAAGLMPDGEE